MFYLKDVMFCHLIYVEKLLSKKLKLHNYLPPPPIPWLFIIDWLPVSFLLIEGHGHEAKNFLAGHTQKYHHKEAGKCWECLKADELIEKILIRPYPPFREGMTKMQIININNRASWKNSLNLLFF